MVQRYILLTTHPLFWAPSSPSHPATIKIQSEIGAANAARHAAGRIFFLDDEDLLIDPLGEGGAKGPSSGCAVKFKGIKFAYPQRPDAQVCTVVVIPVLNAGRIIMPIAL